MPTRKGIVGLEVESDEVAKRLTEGIQAADRDSIQVIGELVGIVVCGKECPVHCR